MKNEYFLDENQLKNDLDRIKEVFNTRSILEEKYSNSNIQKYYKYSSKAYDLFHSKDGAVHMAINYDGVFNQKGYYQQANEISEEVEDHFHVLELGSGKGFNSLALAKQNNNATFKGIDISETHLDYANKKAKDMPNLSFKYGDFQNINYEDNTFDIVFGIEAVCYSEDMEQLLKEVYRVLKVGGKFIVYDGFRYSDYENETPIIKESVALCEKAMVADEFNHLKEWLDVSQKIGYHIDENKDISMDVMPNLKRLYRASRKFYKNKTIAKVVNTVFPSIMVKNSIAGILMAYTIMLRKHSYNKIIMSKKE